MNISELFILAQAAPAGQQQNPMSMVYMMLLMIVLFYFVLIRPQQKKAKEHQALVDAVKIGDQVVTNAGIHGTVANIKDKTVLVKVADNVKIEFDRGAIVSVEKANS